MNNLNCKFCDKELGNDLFAVVGSDDKFCNKKCFILNDKKLNDPKPIKIHAFIKTELDIIKKDNGWTINKTVEELIKKYYENKI